MKCPFCGKLETRVTNKRDSDGTVRRRRECLNGKCRKRFTTYEKMERKVIIVVKKDSRRESYKREKLTAGITKACEKRPVSYEKIEQIVNDIETKLSRKGKETKSTHIGELVMGALKKLDKVAYVRFASVYKDFKDISDFRKEIKDVAR
ncbi:transcriptional regulator NrdR [Candidatus Pacearchaeota archaeon]|nr:transcriptional regulator NrdR [Candidatus Pacearchaeota archaeon]